MVSIFNQFFIIFFLSNFYSSIEQFRNKFTISNLIDIEKLLTQFQSQIQTEANRDKEKYVRVLLKEISESESISYKISSEEMITITAIDNTHQKKIFNSDVSLHIKKGSIFLNSKRLTKKTDLIINTNNEIITLDNQSYHGSLLILKYKKSYLLINRVKLEEYIFSVLKTESWPGWPLEVNKVLAIACRSYAIAKIIESKRAKLPYHIKPTNYHQTYTGIHFNEILRQATLETAGIIMSYNKKPILAMFDCCCGGIVPAHIKSLSNSKIPYLTRTYACEFCKKFKIFNWKFNLNSTDFLKKLRNEFKNIKNLNEIKLHLDKAGTVEKAIIKDGRKTYYLSGQKLYSLFKEIKSFSFNIQRDKNQFTITGKGYGHHIGLCQWGARQMFNEGWNYKNILKFYYPDINFVRLT
jgi:stage II sporulation protein D